uniref:Protein arginine N-methyltransferase domain-containing protein n=1 Tax=Sexangularia sp. CB-2014 TaxID=1486929 RepID=A0A7S1VE72_9EUKA
MSAYFSSYEDLAVHRIMLSDTERNAFYEAALQRAVAACKARGKAPVVLDVGAGTGLLSFLALEAGAAKVIAVEPSEIARSLEAAVAAAAVGDRLTVVHDTIENAIIAGTITPSCVDILVSEWMGFHLVHEGMLASVFAARVALKDDGFMIPEAAELAAQPVSCPDLWNRHVGFWHQESIHSLPLAPFRDAAIAQALAKPLIEALPGDAVVGGRAVIASLDLTSATEEDLVRLEATLPLPLAPGDPTVHAIALSFTVSFQSIVLDTRPSDKPTHWKQSILLLPSPLSIISPDNDSVILTDISLVQLPAADEGGVEAGRGYQISLEYRPAYADEVTGMLAGCSCGRADKEEGDEGDVNMDGEKAAACAQCMILDILRAQ